MVNVRETSRNSWVIFSMLCFQSSADIEILVSNPRDELLTLDVYLEGEELSGANRVSIPPQETLIYKATFSPGSVGKRTGRYV